MCEINWPNLIGILGALASITTAIVALLAYTKWKNPKISELISLEAKNLFSRIQDFRSELVSIRLNMGNNKNVDKDFSEDINQLHTILVNLYAQDRLFNYLIGNSQMIETQSSGNGSVRT